MNLYKNNLTITFHETNGLTTFGISYNIMNSGIRGYSISAREIDIKRNSSYPQGVLKKVRSDWWGKKGNHREEY